MKRIYEEEYVRSEQKNAWFIRRKEFIFQLLKDERKTAKIIEIGCGSGYILDYLQKKGFKKLRGVDSSEYFLKYYKNIKKSIKIPNEKYDIVLLLDVIEHVKEEKTILNKINKILNSGGKLIISVPAYMFLWSHHDELNNHYRRYTSKSLKKILLKTGFKIEKITYWNTIMMPGILLFKKLEKISKKQVSNIESFPVWFNGIYKMILGIENVILRLGINLPFGMSIFAITKKLD